MKENPTRRGTREAFDFWLLQRDVEVAAVIEAAAEKAIRAFLEDHSKEILAAVSRYTKAEGSRGK